MEPRAAQVRRRERLEDSRRTGRPEKENPVLGDRTPRWHWRWDVLAQWGAPCYPPSILPAVLRPGKADPSLCLPTPSWEEGEMGYSVPALSSDFFTPVDIALLPGNSVSNNVIRLPAYSGLLTLLVNALLSDYPHPLTLPTLARY